MDEKQINLFNKGIDSRDISEASKELTTIELREKKGFIAKLLDRFKGKGGR